MPWAPEITVECGLLKAPESTETYRAPGSGPGGPCEWHPGRGSGEHPDETCRRACHARSANKTYDSDSIPMIIRS